MFDIGQKVLKICIVSFGGLAVASCSFGFINRLKMQQLQSALSVDLKDVKDICTKQNQNITRSQNGVYCKLHGTVDTDGVPLVAPESRKQVVLFDTYYKKSKVHKTAQMNFCISSIVDGQKLKVEVEIDKHIDILKLERVVNRFLIREEVLELGKPAFVVRMYLTTTYCYLVGEVRHVAHGDRLIVSRPLYGLPFMISSTTEEELLQFLNFKSNMYLSAGTMFALTSLWCYTKLVLDRFQNVVIPTF